MSFFKWSKTANNNATADPSINWAEGQAPSTVNDSARALMAAAAKYRDDVAGSLVLGGGTTNYTLATNQSFNSLAAMDGAFLTFRMPSTCAGSPTLNVDGLGAKALTFDNSTPLAAGDLKAGRVYSIVYVNSTANFAVIGAGPGSLDAPTGTKLVMVGSVAPAGWTVDTTHNDKALRLRSSATAGSGGSVLFSTLFGRTTTDAVTLAQPNLPNVSLSTSGSVSGSFSGSVSGSCSGSVTGTVTPKIGGIGAAAVQSGAGSTGTQSGVNFTVFNTGAFQGLDTVSLDGGAISGGSISGSCSGPISGSSSGTTSSINGGVGQTTFSPAIDCRVQYAECFIGVKS
jgi:hypothetical protein